MQAMKIPTEFLAVDKFSSVVKQMTASVGNFSKTARASITRLNTRLDNTIGLTDAVKGAFAGITIGAVFATAVQDLKTYEDGVASFRTIVSDLSDKDFAKYENSIAQVAKETKKSTIDVVMSYEKIAGLNATFAQTSEGIAQISKASITLSKASKDELGASTENLVGIMNQFNLGATEADRVINVLAAGKAVGAASITQSAEAYKNFGSVAKGANITLEESQALIQTLGKFSLFGAEAGTKLRGATLQLQKAGIGYASGQFNINDALLEAKQISESLTSQRAKDTFMIKTFGAENITAGKILLANIETYKQFTKGVTGTSEAQKAAEINSATLSTKIEEMKASFTNFITTNDQASASLTIAKNVMGFLAENMSSIIVVLGALLAGFLALKVVAGILNAIALAQTIYNGVMLAYSAVAVTATLTGASFAAVIWATVWPVLAVVAAIAAIIAIFYYWDEIVAWFGKQWENFVNWIGELWDSLVSWFTEFDFKGLFIGIGQAIIDWMLMPLKGVLKLVAMIPGSVGEAAQAGLDKLNSLTDLSMQLGVDNQQAQSPQEIQAQNTQTTKLSGGLNINVNDPNKRTTTESNFNGGIPVKLTSTQGY